MEALLSILATIILISPWTILVLIIYILYRNKEWLIWTFLKSIKLPMNLSLIECTLVGGSVGQENSKLKIVTDIDIICIMNWECILFRGKILRTYGVSKRDVSENPCVKNKIRDFDLDNWFKVCYNVGVVQW